MTGDVRDPAALRRLTDGTEVIISALGPSGKQTDLHTTTAQALVQVMKSAGVRRFIGISGAGVNTPPATRSPAGTRPLAG